jgi:hypothetical protein
MNIGEAQIVVQNVAAFEIFRARTERHEESFRLKFFHFSLMLLKKKK